MENQHRKIAGYRELNADEIALMNLVKQKGEELGNLVRTMELLAEQQKAAGAEYPMDQRWVAIGKTDLQTGIMALVRAIAQPSTF